MLTKEEIWKSIPEYEGYYEISNFGRVRSVEREIITSSGYNKKYTSVFIRPQICEFQYNRRRNPNGKKYQTINIPLSKNGKFNMLSYKSTLNEVFGKNYTILDGLKSFETREDEIFVPIKDFEGYYEISNHGRIKVLPKIVNRSDGFGRNVTEKYLSSNRPQYCLSKNNESHSLLASSLLMYSFYPNVDFEKYYFEKDKEHEILLKRYSIYRRLEHNPVTVTLKDGVERKFENVFQATKELGVNIYKVFESGEQRQMNHLILSDAWIKFDYPIKVGNELKLVRYVIDGRKSSLNKKVKPKVNQLDSGVENIEDQN